MHSVEIILLIFPSNEENSYHNIIIYIAYYACHFSMTNFNRYRYLRLKIKTLIRIGTVVNCYMFKI